MWTGHIGHILRPVHTSHVYARELCRLNFTPVFTVRVHGCWFWLLWTQSLSTNHVHEPWYPMFYCCTKFSIFGCHFGCKMA